ncbi:MAG: thiol:disulfide interchange protein DsbA/DsbL [Gammaproteobacteria bacterium]
MKTVNRWLLALLLAVCATSAAQAKDYKEGTEYVRLATPQPTSTEDRIEVVELFWYGCPHCFHLEPYLEKWLKNKPDDVEFVRIPAVLGASWELLTKAYYVAELLGVLDKTHTALFKVLHVKRQKIKDEAALQAFFAEQGVSKEDFTRTFNSFAVAVKLNNSRLMTKRYALTGVPTLVVNGKFSSSSSRAGGNAQIIEVVDYLVTLERAAGSGEQVVSGSSE